MIYQFPNYDTRIKLETNSQNDRIAIDTITEMFYNFMKTGYVFRLKTFALQKLVFDFLMFVHFFI